MVGNANITLDLLTETRNPLRLGADVSTKPCGDSTNPPPQKA